MSAYWTNCVVAQLLAHSPLVLEVQSPLAARKKHSFLRLGIFLGPLLLLAFINDFPESVEASDPLLLCWRLPAVQTHQLWCWCRISSTRSSCLGRKGKKVANEVPHRTTNETRYAMNTATMVTPLKLLTLNNKYRIICASLFSISQLCVGIPWFSGHKPFTKCKPGVANLIKLWPHLHMT